MTKVITYGTYDLLHYGHIRLIERAKELGDYLIVGVTSDDFDRDRGKINIRQSVMERVEAIRATGLADEIIVEEYEGQKIDDIRRLGIDIFAIGSDWEGKFDYLKEYCDVVYLERTEGVSSTLIRSNEKQITLGFVGDVTKREFGKYIKECSYVNGIRDVRLLAPNNQYGLEQYECYSDYKKLLENCDAVYIASNVSERYAQIKYALMNGKHVLCKSPIATTKQQCIELYELAKNNNLILMDSIKTAYATAYNRLKLLVKSGRIGEVLSIDVTCTSLQEVTKDKSSEGDNWNSISSWGPVGLLPVYQLLGTDYKDVMITSRLADDKENFDIFSKVDFVYPSAVASVKVGTGYKSEGELVISGTQGYIYVPAPWWKTDYFEIRFENIEDNKRYFYQLDGEGIRYELVAFARSICNQKSYGYIDEEISEGIVDIIEKFYKREKIRFI